MESNQTSFLDKYCSMEARMTWWKPETQEKISQMKVLVLGLTGLGIEVVKNLVMISIGQVCLYDQTIVSLQDVGRNLFLNQNHIGKFTRAQASLKPLQQINPNCKIKITNNINIDYINTNFNCVVVIDQYDKTYLTKLNQQCRQNGVGFIMGGCLGLYGFTFVDFGNKHMIDNLNGQEPRLLNIKNISREENGVVSLHDVSKVTLSVGDTIEFKEVEGMEEINGRQYKILDIKQIDYYQYQFKIGDTRNFAEYQHAGIATQVKELFIMPFKSLSESLQSPQAIDLLTMPTISDSIMDLSKQMHVTLLAVYEFYSKNKRLPQVLNEQDTQELLLLVKSSNFLGLESMKDGCESFDVRNIDENIVLNTARYAQTQILPICMFWGGIIAQEVVKYTGQYKPLKQWLHHQLFSLLPCKTNISRTMNNKSKYSDYVALFGDKFIQKCSGSKLLLVGGNETANEMIKILGSMGMSIKQKSAIYVADSSTIKLKDTLTHSLLKEQDQGQIKSQILCKKSNVIWSSNFVSIKDQLKQQTQQIYNDDFWDSLDFVISTIDNKQIINYIDNQCVWYEKALFVCNTKGLTSFSNIILPFKTQSYTDVEHEAQYTIDFSTLRNFIYRPEHAILSGKDMFERFFVEISLLMDKFYSNKEAFIQQIIQHRNLSSQKLNSLKKYLIANQLRSYEYCLEIVLEIFNEHFKDNIERLLQHFPPDYKDEYSQRRFWSGLKRCPQVIEFDLTDPVHLQFVRAGAEILSKIFNIQSLKDQTQIKDLIAKVYERLPKNQTVQKPRNRSQAEQEAEQIEQEIKQKNLIKQLSDLKLDPLEKPNLISQLDLDDPANWHLEFIHANINLRAKTYRLSEIDRFSIRKILKKVPEKVITAVSLSAGLMGIEMIKYLKDNPVESFRNTIVNLAVNVLCQTQLLPPIINTDKEFDPILCGPVKVIKPFTKWDKIIIPKPMLVWDLLEYIKKTYGVEVSMLAMGCHILYSTWTDKIQNKIRLTMSVEDVIEEVTNKQVYRWKNAVGIDISAENGQIDYLFPVFKYYFAPVK